MSQRLPFVFCAVEGNYKKVESPCDHLLKIGFTSGSDPLFFFEKYLSKLRRIVNINELDLDGSLDDFQ